MNAVRYWTLAAVLLLSGCVPAEPRWFTDRPRDASHFAVLYFESADTERAHVDDIVASDGVRQHIYDGDFKSPIYLPLGKTKLHYYCPSATPPNAGSAIVTLLTPGPHILHCGADGAVHVGVPRR